MGVFYWSGYVIGVLATVGAMVLPLLLLVYPVRRRAARRVLRRVTGRQPGRVAARTAELERELERIPRAGI